MADKILAVDAAAQNCELKELVKYPDVVKANDTTIVTVTTDAQGKKTYSIAVNKIGVDRNGDDVLAGDCLVTCATDIFASKIDDTGTTTTITLNNGSTITSPETDENTYVTGFAIVGDVATITMSDGTNHVSNITHPAFPADIYVTGFTIAGDDATVALSNGDTFTQTITHPAGTVNVNLTDATIDPVAETITYTFSDGTSFVKPHPAGSIDTKSVVVAGENTTVTSTVAGDTTTYTVNAAGGGGGSSSITDITHTYDNDTGYLTVASSDGTESAPQNSHESDMYPSMQFKCKIPTATDTSTTTPALNPIPLASIGNRSNAYGSGWNLAAGGTWTVPKTGIWLVDFRTLYNAVAGSGASDEYTVRLNVNGSPLQGLSCPSRDSVGTPPTRSSLTRTMAVPLSAGDIVSGQVEVVSGAMHISGFEGRMAYQSSIA